MDDAETERELFRKGQIDWAEITLKKANIRHADGRMSHQNALEVLKKVEEERLKARTLQEKREPLIEAAKKTSVHAKHDRNVPGKISDIVKMPHEERKKHYQGVLKKFGQEELNKLIKSVRRERSRTRGNELG